MEMTTKQKAHTTSHEVAAADAQALADESRRAAFMIFDDRDGRFAVTDLLDAEEYSALSSAEYGGPLVVVEFQPALSLNESFCEACKQVLHSSTLGGRTVTSVLYRSDDGLHWIGSRWTEHTAANCEAWRTFFVTHFRPAYIGYNGAA